MALKSVKTPLPVLIYQVATSVCFRKNNTVNRRLLELFNVKVSPSKTPKDGVVSADITIDASRDLWLRVYTSATPTSANVPVVVFMHGGGFCMFRVDSANYDRYCRVSVNQLNAVIVSVNYRLAPEHKFPCQYEDSFDALKFIDAHFDRVAPCADPSKCLLIGDSAGGNLIHHVMVKASQDAYEFKRINIRGLVLIQPFFGGESRTRSEIVLGNQVPLLNLKRADWLWKAFLPTGSDRNHPAANVFGSNSSDISGVNFPAILLVIGGLDILQDWQRDYGERMKKLGNEVNVVEYPNALHGFFGFKDVPEYSEFFKELKNFITRQVSSLK